MTWYMMILEINQPSLTGTNVLRVHLEPGFQGKEKNCPPRAVIAPPRAVNVNDATIVDKGCFVVYSCDGVRFVITIDYLMNDLFQELLEMAVEEYGLQRDGPIRLPLNAALMQYTISHIERQISKELEEELRITITSWKCLSTSNMQFEQVQTQLLVQRKLKPSTRKEPTFSQESQPIANFVASTKTPGVLPIQKVNPISLFLNSLTQTDKPQNPQFIAPVIKPQKYYEEFDNVESFEHLFIAEPENAESTVQFDAEDYEEYQENLNQETPTEFPMSDIKQYFTFDDIPPSKWHERSIEMLTWCTAELHPWEHTIHAREEFLKMKCCSFQKKDLEKHYDHMSQRFYCLNGVDDVNLKQVFLNSFPESLENEAYRALEEKNKKFLSEFERTGKCLGIACDDKYLQIKCKDKSSCDCHFARNCPDKKRSQALIQALNQVEPVDVSDLESLYSLDDEPSDSVLCMIAYSYFSSDDDSDSDSLESDSDFRVYMINPIPYILPIQEDPPLPLAKIYLLTDAYAKPIPVIAFFDTGSSVSILNPNILPDHYWKPHHQNFMAANGEKFVIDKISVPINIRLFPKCVIKRRLLGSSSHGKDLLIGFDILHKLPNLRWTGEGLHYRSFFNPWTAMHRLFVASITPPIFNINNIKQRLI
ncbi:putative zinc finger, CCHC-type containing protein [Tanacetum coccineum]|uniref:Zinc finger, CCHC-type containing protein n=1 Tax=Tanacetum coccineum TaxID=301880 RepID=A0ABQ5CR14_9ASTR